MTTEKTNIYEFKGIRNKVDTDLEGYNLDELLETCDLMRDYLALNIYSIRKEVLEGIDKVRNKDTDFLGMIVMEENLRNLDKDLHRVAEFKKTVSNVQRYIDLQSEE